MLARMLEHVVGEALRETWNRRGHADIMTVVHELTEQMGAASEPAIGRIVQAPSALNHR